MEFKNKRELLNYLSNPEILGDINVYTRNGGLGTEVVVNYNKPENLTNEIEEKLDITSLVYEYLLDYEDYIPDYIDFTIKNINGVATMVANLSSTSPEYDDIEIQNQLKELLNDILFENYSLSLTLEGDYHKRFPDNIKLEEYYLGKFINDNEIDFTEHQDYIKYKEIILSSLYEWARGFSSEISRGEYEMDEFWIQLNSSNAFEDNFDYYFSFGEKGSDIPDFLEFSETMVCNIIIK
jgi:hypothetical protein